MIRCLSCFQLYPLVVVEANVVVDDLLRLLKGKKFVLAERFFFEMSEEVFHGGVVPAIAAPGHGGSDVILASEDKIRLRSVLLPLVTVEDQSISDLFFLFGLAQVLLNQGDRVFPSELVGDDETVVKILDRRQIGPAFPGQNVGDIGDPFLVGSGGREIPIEQVGIGMIGLQLGHFPVDMAFSGHRADPQLVHQA